jgi:hypothetical protein
MIAYKVSAVTDKGKFFRFVSSKVDIPTQKAVVADQAGVKKIDVIVSEEEIPTTKYELIKYLNEFSA